MSDGKLTIKRRNLPHWTIDGSTYYVTFHLLAGELTKSERAIVLNHIKQSHRRFYQLAAVAVMPDHVHLVLRPLAEYALSRIMKGIKGVSSHLINQARGTTGSLWQDESWDRIVRDPEQFEEKLHYMWENPFKAELVQPGELWDGWWSDPEIM